MSSQERANQAWDEDLPDWVRLLAEEYDRTSQKRAATLIGYSATVVNQVLKRTYTGDMGAVEQAVQGALMSATVNCPVYGELPSHRCLEYQRQPFAATNPTRVRLYRACRNGCPNSRLHRHGGDS